MPRNTAVEPVDRSINSAPGRYNESGSGLSYKSTVNPCTSPWVVFTNKCGFGITLSGLALPCKSGRQPPKIPGKIGCALFSYKKNKTNPSLNPPNT